MKRTRVIIPKGSKNQGRCATKPPKKPDIVTKTRSLQNQSKGKQQKLKLKKKKSSTKLSSVVRKDYLSMFKINNAAKSKKIAPTTRLIVVKEIIYPIGYMDSYLEYRANIDEYTQRSRSGSAVNSTLSSIADRTIRVTGLFYILNEKTKQVEYEKKMCVKSKEGFIPFPENYFIYEAVLSEATDNVHVDFYINKINGMETYPIRKKQYLYAEQISMILSQDLKCKQTFITECLRTLGSWVGVLKPAHFYAYGDGLVNRLKMTTYFVFSSLFRIIQAYKSEISFDSKKMLSVFDTNKIAKFNDLINNRIWRLGLPSVRKNFGIRDISIMKYKEIESIFGNKGVFPDVYYYVVYINEAIVMNFEKRTDMYCNITDLFINMHNIYKRVSTASSSNVKMDCVGKVFLALENKSRGFEFYKQRKYTNQLVSMLNLIKPFKEAIALLIRTNCIYVDTGTIVNVEDRVYEGVMEIMASKPPSDIVRNLMGNGFVDCLNYFSVVNGSGPPVKVIGGDIDLDEDLVENEGSTFELVINQKFYPFEIWDLQTRLLNQIRKLIFYNYALRGTMKLGEIDTHDTAYLNREQSEALTASIDVKHPIMACIGNPGTGKTEVVKQYCAIYSDITGATFNDYGEDVDKEVILILATYGISVDVLKRRIFAEGSTIENVYVATLDSFYFSVAFGSDKNVLKSKASQIVTLFVDEFQNVDLKRFVRVLEHLPILKKLRLFGDLNQIEPILTGMIGLEMMKGGHGGYIEVVKLVENNRVKKNPKSSSIVSNFLCVTSTKYHDLKGYNIVANMVGEDEKVVAEVKGIEEGEPFFEEIVEEEEEQLDVSGILDNKIYEKSEQEKILGLLEKDDLGSRFLNMNERETISFITDLYKRSSTETFKEIDMIAPLRKVVERMNFKLAPIIRNIIIKKNGWENNVGIRTFVPFCIKWYKGQRQNILSIGNKLKFGKNYKTTTIAINNRTERITSDGVSTGELAWVCAIETFSSDPQKVIDIYRIAVVLKDGDIKRVVIGPKHVDPKHVRLGYVSTIDSFLGGENSRVVFYMGDNEHFSIENGKTSIFRSLNFVDRKRLTTAISRASKTSYVIGPRIVSVSKMFLCNMYSYREMLKGRYFNNPAIFTKNSYDLDSRVILMLMADYKPRDRRSDLGLCLGNVVRYNYKVQYFDMYTKYWRNERHILLKNKRNANNNNNNNIDNLVECMDEDVEWVGFMEIDEDDRDYNDNKKKTVTFIDLDDDNNYSDDDDDVIMCD